MSNLQKVIRLSKSQYTKLLNGESIIKEGITYTYDANAMYLVENENGEKHVEGVEWVKQSPILTITFNETLVSDRSWVAIYDSAYPVTNPSSTVVYMSLTDHSTLIGTISVPISSGKFAIEIENANAGYVNYVNTSSISGGVSNVTIGLNMRIETWVYGDISDDGSFTCSIDYGWD